MSVYVDPEGSAPGQIGRVVFSCHMYADTKPELIAHADKIGLQRSWIQFGGIGKIAHYDLTKGKRKQAVAKGAIEITYHQAGLFVRAHRTGDADKKEFLEALAHVRGEFAFGNGDETDGKPESEKRAHIVKALHAALDEMMECHTDVLTSFEFLAEIEKWIAIARGPIGLWNPCMDEAWEKPKHEKTVWVTDRTIVSAGHYHHARGYWRWNYASMKIIGPVAWHPENRPELPEFIQKGVWP